MKVIPAIDLLEGRVVRLREGKRDTARIYSQDPIAVALRWESEGADLIHLIDLNAAFEDGNNRDIIARIRERIKTPLQVGGGIRSTAAAREIMSIGVDRIVLGTMAFKDIAGTATLLEELGQDRVVVALDHRRGTVRLAGWTASSGTLLEPAMQQLWHRGAREFLITSIERDGAMTGPDLETLAPLCADKRFSVIASGGVHTLEDVQALWQIGASGAVIGTALYEGAVSLSRLLDLPRQEPSDPIPQ